MNCDKKIINIINLIIDKEKNTMSIELAYKSEKSIENLEMCCLIKDENIYAKETIKHISVDENIILSKFDIELNSEKNVSIIIKDRNEIFNTEITDNKNNDIVEGENEYKVFTKKYTIEIKKEAIIITSKKICEKLKYEINKMLYSKKRYKKFCFYRLLNGKKKYYLFNDRISYADDNAEQLFIYINKTYPKMAKKCYFVIDKNSKRYEYLKKIGNVLDYGSFKHKVKYLNCRMVLSSHSSYYDRVYNPFDNSEMDLYKDIINKKFVFLQHGVVMNDVHSMINRTKSIADLFITTTNSEYENLKLPMYLYNDSQVVCTGLPRFDRLVNESKKNILIAPTWRTFLTDVEYNKGQGYSFENSEFYNKYKNILENKDLLNEIKKSGYKIKFLLHPVFSEHKSEFEKLANENIEILSIEDIRYCDLFKECDIFITDYSSTHFDVAFLQKPIIYYQFDKEKFFESHYQKGYYDYDKDGFGEVIEDEEKVINKIIFYLKNDCKIEDKYLKKIEDTFKNLDKNNCERIYKEIVRIDKKSEKDYRFNNVH